MPSARMRRVDEAVRVVLSEAVATDIKDPRVGFVTVTSVETSPDLRHATVFVSVLGDEPTREASLEGSSPPTASCSGGSPPSCGSSTRRRCASPTTTRSTTACGSPSCSTRSRSRGRRHREPATDLGPAYDAVLDELRTRRQVPARHPRAPRRRRARLDHRHARDPRAHGQGRGHVHRPRRVPAPAGVRLPDPRGARRLRARRHPRAHGGVPRLRQHGPQPVRRPAA